MSSIIFSLVIGQNSTILLQYFGIIIHNFSVFSVKAHGMVVKGDMATAETS